MATSIKPSELQLGDVVDLHFPYGYATVYQINEGKIHLTRPYIHSEDWSYIGNQIITYIGHNEFSISAEDSRPITLVERKKEPVK